MEQFLNLVTEYVSLMPVRLEISLDDPALDIEAVIVQSMAVGYLMGHDGLEEAQAIETFGYMVEQARSFANV